MSEECKDWVYRLYTLLPLERRRTSIPSERLKATWLTSKIGGHWPPYDASGQANIALMCFYRWMNKPSGEGQAYWGRVLSFLLTDNGQRVAICAFSIIATLILIAFEGGALAYVFGLPYMFFIPGFAVVRLFFRKEANPETKFVLSLGLSIVVVILLGVVLALTPIGLYSDTTRASLILFTLGAVAFETLYPKKWRGQEPEKIRITSGPPVKIDKVVAAMLAVALGISVISIGLVITAEYPSRTYFAMTGEDGKVITNVTRLVNTSIVFNIEMKNGEGGPRTFTLVAYGVSTVGERDTQTFSRLMADGELWIQTVTFALNVTGYYRVNFDLYIQNEGEPQYLYGNLHLWFGVVYEL